MKTGEALRASPVPLLSPMLLLVVEFHTVADVYVFEREYDHAC